MTFDLADLLGFLILAGLIALAFVATSRQRRRDRERMERLRKKWPPRESSRVYCRSYMDDIDSARHGSKKVPR